MRAFASLRRQAEFDRLRKRGRRTVTDALTLYRSDGHSRDRVSLVGITVSKAVGIAVVRNRIRRRLGAIADEMLRELAPLRLLIVARPQAAVIPFAALREQFQRALS
jgi:ribonuclease P protein component